MSSKDNRIVEIKIADRLANIRDAIKLDNSKKNKSFKKYYLKQTKQYFIPYLNENISLHKDLILAWYKLRDNYLEEEYRIK